MLETASSNSPFKGDHGAAFRNSQNNTFYSFGGQTPIKSAFKHQNNIDVFNRTFTSINESVRGQTPREVRVINKKPNVHMNDYTKNISQSIFSPGDTVKSKGNRFAVDHRKIANASSTYSRAKS